jgi:hypothetical protein
MHSWNDTSQAVYQKFAIVEKIMKYDPRCGSFCPSVCSNTWNVPALLECSEDKLSKIISTLQEMYSESMVDEDVYCNNIYLDVFNNEKSILL